MHSIVTVKIKLQISTGAGWVISAAFLPSKQISVLGETIQDLFHFRVLKKRELISHQPPKSIIVIIIVQNIIIIIIIIIITIRTMMMMTMKLIMMMMTIAMMQIIKTTTRTKIITAFDKTPQERSLGMILCC